MLLKTTVSATEAGVNAPEEDLLVLARDGDGAAFADLVRRHQARVFSLALRIVGDRAVAEELAQDVFLRLHQSLDGLASEAHVGHWLRRVVSHRAIDAARHRGRRPQACLSDVAEPGVCGPEPDLLLARRLRRLVAELPPTARAVVTLRFQEDLKLSEIARTLELPLNTVKSHLRRALAVLRARAQPLMESDRHADRG